MCHCSGRYPRQEAGSKRLLILLFNGVFYLDSMVSHPFVPADIEAALGQRYVVNAEIATGGQGAVFKAIRKAQPDGTATNDVVALKLHLYPGQDMRVQREIAAMEDLSHPNLARLIEHGYCDVAARRTRYIAWELIEGQTLSHRIKTEGRMRESEILPIGRDVSAAIAAIWSRQIVHGDIKPSNIMLKEAGGAILIDLGAARYLKEPSRRPFRPLGTYPPEPTSSLGTVGYFSPEQARGEKNLTCASDIFSLGVVMLQSLQGWHPTNYDQNALAEGLRASDRKLPLSGGLLSALDQMLLARAASRPNPARVSAYFETLRQRMEDEFAKGARPSQPTQQP